MIKFDLSGYYEQIYHSNSFRGITSKIAMNKCTIEVTSS